MGMDGMRYTIDHAIDSMRVGRFHYRVFLLCGLCWVAVAMELFLVSYIGDPVRCEWDGIGDMHIVALTTVVFVGTMGGAVFFGKCADTYGRKMTFQWFVTTVAVSGVVGAAAPTYGVLLVSRGFVGFGMGGSPIAFTLLLEYTPSSVRGPCGVVFCLFWSLGAITEAALAAAVLPSLGWRWLAFLSALPLCLLILLFPLIPESPRFLLAHSRYRECTQLLSRVAISNKTSLPLGSLLVPFETGEQEGGEARELEELDGDSIHESEMVGENSCSGIDYHINATGDSLITTAIAPATVSPEQTLEEGGRVRLVQSELNSDSGSRKGAATRTWAGRMTLQAWQGPMRGSAAVGSSLPPLEKGAPLPSRGGVMMRSLGLDVMTHRETRWVTLLMFVMWFVASFSYYGIVLVSTELYAHEDAGERCAYTQVASSVGNATGSNSTRNSPLCELPSADTYIDTFITSVGEIPGVLLTMVGVQRWGRKQTVVVGSALQCILCVLLVPCTSRSFENFLLFALRAVSVGYFQAIYVLTGEFYPSATNATVLGWCSTLARFGSVLTPFVANMLASVDTILALAVYALLAIVCCVSAYLIPYDTRNRAIPLSDVELRQLIRSKGNSTRRI